MAHRITYKPAGILLSSAFGDVDIQVDGDYVDVALSAEDGDVVLSERYYAHDGRVTLRGLASLFENVMRIRGNAYADFSLSVFTDTPSVNADEHTFHIMYCDRFSVCTDVPVFLKENFLTTLRMRRVTPDDVFSLSLFSDMDETLMYTVTARCRHTNGNEFSHTFTADVDKKATATGIPQINISVAALVRDAAAAIAAPTSDVSIMMFTVNCGTRSVTCFVDRSLSLYDGFYFRNCFNVWDCVRLPMTTTAKTDVERSTAVINGASRFYNQSVTKSYEVAITPLTSDEAEWIDQLFTAHEVFRYEPNDCDDTEPIIAVQVLITDMSCEISDADDKPNTVKFTWRYADNRPIVRLVASPGIFNDKFQPPFS